MKVKMFLSAIVAISFILTAFTYVGVAGEDERGYIGAKKCGMCHKKDAKGNQLKKWQDSPHSKAYETLKTEASKEYSEDAVNDPNCLKCHATAAGVDAKLLDKKFKIEDGVQCESCHGAGKDYKSMKVMKDHAKSVAAGMVNFKNDKGETDMELVKAMCETCHNKESPTFKGFDFEKRFAEVDHRAPKK